MFLGLVLLIDSYILLVISPMEHLLRNHMFMNNKTSLHEAVFFLFCSSVSNNKVVDLCISSNVQGGHLGFCQITASQLNVYHGLYRVY